LHKQDGHLKVSGEYRSFNNPESIWANPNGFFYESMATFIFSTSKKVTFRILLVKMLGGNAHFK